MSVYTAIATSGGRNTRSVTSDGKLDVELSLQKEFGGDGAGTNPEQLFAAGYSACFASSIEGAARRRRIDVTGVAVTAEVGLHGPDHDGRFKLGAALRVELPDRLSAETKHDLVDAAHQVCPYSNATRGNIPVSVEIA